MSALISWELLESSEDPDCAPDAGAPTDDGNCDLLESRKTLIVHQMLGLRPMRVATYQNHQRHQNAKRER
jgi:hypothetical protein